MFFSFSVPRDHSTSIRVGILEARSLIISTNASISPQGVPISGLTDPIRLVLCMGRIVDAFASVYRCVNNFSKSTTTGLPTNPLMSGTLTGEVHCTHTKSLKIEKYIKNYKFKKKTQPTSKQIVPRYEHWCTYSNSFQKIFKLNL